MPSITVGRNSTQQQITSSLSYLLQNTGISPTSVTINQITGQVSNPYSQTTLSYLYQYLLVAYATNSTGTQGFSYAPTNATYYGLRNQSTTTADANPADYIWIPVSGGFGTSNFLFYSAIGGRQVQFAVGATAPNASYDPVGVSVPINLDVITLVGSAGNAVSANTSITAQTVINTNQPNITQVGTLNFLNVTGDVSAAFFIGNGTNLTNIPGANVTGTVASATHATTSTTSTFATTAGSVTNASQPAITSLGDLVGLNIGPWTITPTGGGNLLFSVGATNLMSLSNSGNLVLAGNVSHGTPS